jgi:hypothetical protein
MTRHAKNWDVEARVCDAIAALKAPHRQSGWRSKLICTKDGSIKALLANAITVLRHALSGQTCSRLTHFHGGWFRSGPRRGWTRQPGRGVITTTASRLIGCSTTVSMLVWKLPVRPSRPSHGIDNSTQFVPTWTPCSGTANPGFHGG